MPVKTSWRIDKLEPIGEWLWHEQIAPEPDIEDYLRKHDEKGFLEELSKSYRGHSKKVNCCKCGRPAQLAYVPPDYDRNDVQTYNPNHPELPFVFTFWCWGDWRKQYGRPRSKQT